MYLTISFFCPFWFPDSKRGRLEIALTFWLAPSSQSQVSVCSLLPKAALVVIFSHVILLFDSIHIKNYTHEVLINVHPSRASLWFHRLALLNYFTKRSVTSFTFKIQATNGLSRVFGIWNYRSHTNKLRNAPVSLTNQLWARAQIDFNYSSKCPRSLPAFKENTCYHTSASNGH